MRPFSYARASTVAEAIELISSNGGASENSAFDTSSKLIAGGTNLVDLMKADAMRPSRIVDLTRLPLNKIEDLPDGGLRLGALATNASTAYDSRVQNRYPILSRAILSGATPQLRNMATNGGNILQRTRCYYFYDSGTPCNKRAPGSGCGAIHGFNRIHAILGASDQCIATHPSDMAVALAALEAVVRVRGSGGERAIALRDFHRLPGNTPEVDTNLRSDELIISIDLPSTGYADHYTYVKVRDRASYAFALVSVAAGLVIDGGMIREVRLAMGGVAHKPWRDPEAERMLIGQPAATESFRRVAEFMMRDAKGYGHNTFKIELARRAIVRALEEATGLAEKDLVERI